MKKIYIVTDLGPGDGGKGGVVHKLSHMRKAHTILKVGGAQGSHGVSTSSGYRFAFSQFGCGTFEGVNTHLTERFIASPEGILNEAAALRYEHGIHTIFDHLTMEENVVCATPYHGISSRLKELARKSNPRGTIGTGVGEAFRYAHHHPDHTIRAKDLSLPGLRTRVERIRDQLHVDLHEIVSGDFLPEDRDEVDHEVLRLNDPGFLDYIVDRFREVGRLVRVVPTDYISDYLAPKDGVMIVESSHGVLTDHFQGFHPHTSAIRTLPRFAREMIEQVGYDGEVVSLGVTRAYQIRHGAGPMPTADIAMAESLLPGSHKEENRYQGVVRVGPLDLVLLRYAIAASGGPSAYDGLAITWFDQIQKNGSWSLCQQYHDTSNETFFTSSGDIRVRLGDDAAQLRHQEELAKELLGCVPEVLKLDVSSSAGRGELYDICASVLQEKLGIDVRMVSFGSTEQDKMCR